MLDLSKLELGWTQKAPMPEKIFGFGIATNSEEQHIFVIGGRRPGATTSDLIRKYNPTQDQWSTIAAQLPMGGSPVSTSKSLDGYIWLLRTHSPMSVDRFNVDTETLDGLNIANVPGCRFCVPK